MQSRRLHHALLFLSCFLAGAAGLSADPQSPAGSWEGSVIWTPAEVEIDLQVDLADSGPGSGQGNWSGRLAAPAANVEGHVLAGVAVQGRTVAFEHQDRPARGRFIGTLSEDAQRIEGEFSPADGGKGAPFVLRRGGETRPAAADLLVLAGPEDLKAHFNFDQGAPRLVLLLAPTCEMCRMGARLVQRYVLEQIDDPRLRVFVVWLPLSEEDTSQTARRAAGDLSDPRVRHFWVGDTEIAQAFAATLGIKNEPAWDVFLVYGPGAVWKAGPPPVPRYTAHRSSELPAEFRYNAVKLAAAIRDARTARATK